MLQLRSFLEWYQNRKVPHHHNCSIELFQYHRLDMILLSYCLENNIKADFTKALLVKQEEISRKQQQYRLIAHDISNQLSTAGIRHVFLKGLVLSQTLYRESFHRYYSDIDLLVDKNKLEDTERILKSMGYVYGYYSHIANNEIHPATRAEIQFQRLFTHELYNMCRKEAGNWISNVDINFLFTWKGVNSKEPVLSLSDFHDHIVVENDIPFFDPVINMIHLCCHLFNEGLFFALANGYRNEDPSEIILIRVLDISLLANTMSIQEKNAVMQIANRLNLSTKVEHALGLANYCLGKNIWDDSIPLPEEHELLFNYYVTRDGARHKWPISIDVRISNLEEKASVVKKIFQDYE